eukprot:SAG31_NODE_26_length_32985_cov_39.054096_17_plen_59_part_00
MATEERPFIEPFGLRKSVAFYPLGAMSASIIHIDYSYNTFIDRWLPDHDPLDRSLNFN